MSQVMVVAIWRFPKLIGGTQKYVVVGEHPIETDDLHMIYQKCCAQFFFFGGGLELQLMNFYGDPIVLTASCIFSRD